VTRDSQEGEDAGVDLKSRNESEDSRDCLLGGVPIRNGRQAREWACDDQNEAGRGESLEGMLWR